MQPRIVISMPQYSPSIAIVDDDAFVLKALARLLRARALRAKTYNSAQDFLVNLGEGPPECLIVDLQMPKMSGLDLLQRLTREGIQIPSIVITARNDHGQRERCKSAGATAFLLKPIQYAALFSAIDDALRS
jgi:FixJ family two-component response regulator